MKIFDVIRLSLKNLFNNFMRSFLMLTTLTLLSVIIILLSNFCVYFKTTTDADILRSINKNGVSISFDIKTDKNNTPKMPSIKSKDVSSFIDKTTQLGLDATYTLHYEDLSSDTLLAPFIAEYNYLDVILGNKPDYKNKNANYIWINKELSLSKNIELEEDFVVNINGQNKSFVVKGIIDGTSKNYIDYSHFNITRVEVVQEDVTFSDYSIINKISSIARTAPKNTVISEFSISYLRFYLVLGVCSFLVLFSILFSLGSVLNILKITMEDNYYSIGIMKQLGMRKNNVILYILTQLFTIIAISTVLSTFIAWIVSRFTLHLQIGVVAKMFGYHKDSIRAGFNLLLPLLNLLILGITIYLGSSKMLNKHLAKDIIEIMQEAEQ